MKKGYPTLTTAALVLCGCGWQQQSWEPQWGKDCLYTWEERAAKEIESQEYRSKILDAALGAANISLEKHFTQNGARRKRSIRLHTKEQQTLRMLLHKATYHPVKNDTSIHATIPADEWTELVITDSHGKRLYHGTVQLCPESLVSRDGYALGAYLALSDENYCIWKKIVYQKYTAPPAQEHENATAQHRQAVREQNAMLRNCKTAEIDTFLNIAPACRIRKLTPKETQELCSLLRRCQPLPFLGSIPDLRISETTIRFYNEDGEQIGSRKTSDITDAASARNRQHCTTTESMYLPTADYQRLMQLLQEATD